MTTKTDTRPSYVSDDLVADCCDRLTPAVNAGDCLRMFKTLKLLKSILVNVGGIAIGLYSIKTGADPFTIALVSFAFLSAYNGLELSDYMVFVRVYRELSGDDEPATEGE